MSVTAPAAGNGLPPFMIDAQQAMHRYDFSGAAQILERALRSDPTNDRIMVEIGAAYTKAYDFAAAERWFEEGVRSSSMKTSALNAIGHHWMEVRNFEAAKRYFDIVMEQPNTPVATFIRVYEIYVRMRKLKEAEEVVERATKMYGKHEGVLLIRGKLFRELKQLPAAQTVLRALTTNESVSLDLRAAAWYEMAAIMDQQERYTDAMAALKEAKKLMGMTVATPIKILKMKQQRMRELHKSVSEVTMEKWRKSAASDLQPLRNIALLCGHARSGTTLLEYIVDAHPQVTSADETSVFHNKAYYPLGHAVGGDSNLLRALDWMAPRIIRQIRTDYWKGIESYLGKTVNEGLLVDKNPANTFDIPVLARMFPEMKYLVALRDPRDVCLSCFMQAVPIIPDTASWLTLEGTIEHYTCIMGIWLGWKKALGANAIEVRYEDVVSDLEPTARKALSFLGLPWDDRVLRHNESVSTKIVRSPTFAEVNKPIYKTAVARWRNYEKFFQPHLKQFEPFFKEFGYE